MCLILQDAHNTILDYDKEAAFFAVYDGHGGHEVAEYTGIHFPKYLINNDHYKQGNFEKVRYNHIQFDY